MQLRPLLSLKQELRLQQILSPKIIQMLKTFNLSYSDLVDEVKKEAKDNVFIEVVENDKYYSDYLVHKGNFNTDYQGDDTRDLAVWKPEKSQSLEEYLLSQLALEDLRQIDKEIAQMLIENLDERGYFTDFATLKAKVVAKFQVQERKVMDILKIIQTFEPDGVGARSLKECLLIQVENYNFDSDTLRKIIRITIQNHFDALAEQRYDSIAQKLEIEMAGVKAVHNFIRENLNPNPGSAFSNKQFEEIIIPSFEVKLEGEKVVIINLEKQKGIQVHLSQNYQNILTDPSLDQKTKDYLSEKLERAKNLIENMEKRAENLEKLVTLIVEKQEKFLKKGKFYLEPFLQKTASEIIGVSASTISRIVSSKYILTPHGIFSLKALCPRDHFGKTKERLKNILLDIIKNQPNLSDNDISILLKSEGIDIARRTVNKYRH